MQLFIYVFVTMPTVFIFMPTVLWISEEEGRRHRIAFNSLYLFSFRPIIYEANGEELYNVTRGVTASRLSIVRELPQFLAPLCCVARYHPGSVASMTRDKGYPDWLVLSARLLAQPSCGQVKIVQNIYVWSCSLVAMWRYYSLLLYVLLFS